jgi:Tfp pilus assembly protein PilF
MRIEEQARSGPACLLNKVLGVVLLALVVNGNSLGGQQASPRAEPSALDQQFQKGVEALKAGRLAEAEKAFQQVLVAAGGESGFVHHNLGIVYQQRGDHAKAVDQFRQAIATTQDDASSHALFGVSLLALGKTTEAVTQLATAVELDPEDANVRFQLALAYERAGDTPNAVEQLRVVRRIEPREPEHAYRLGKAYVDLAAWLTRQMMESDPQSPRVFQMLGENYMVQGNLELAERNLVRAAELGPRVPGVHWALAQLYLRKGDKAAALRELDRELAAVPGSLMALRMKQQLEKQP